MDRGPEGEGARRIADVPGKLDLARAGDRARRPVAATGPREDTGSECGDLCHGVRRVDKAENGVEVAPPRQAPQPLATEPESRALVADERAETAGARPATAPVVRDDDRPGSREHEHARPVADGAEERCLCVRDHLDAPSQAAEREREGAALARGPERPRGDDEGRDVATAPAATSPDRAEEHREPPEIPVGAHHGRRDSTRAA